MLGKVGRWIAFVVLFVLLGLGISDIGASNEYWITTLDQSGHAFQANVVVATSDGGAVFAGARDDSKVAWVLKKNNLGQTLWNYSYSGTYFANFLAGAEMSDGSILVAGANSYNGQVGGEAWVMKLSQNGQVVYHSLLRSGSYGYVNDIQPTSDGGAILVGYTYSTVRSDDIWMLRINSSGGIVWQTYYDGGNGSDAATAISIASDGYYIVGWTNTYPMLMKTDLSGNQLWVRAYNGEFALRDVAATADGVVLSGGTALGHTIVARIDSSGIGQWVRIYDFGSYDEGNGLNISSGNIVLATGYSGNVIKISYNNGTFLGGTHIAGANIQSLVVLASGEMYVGGNISQAAMVGSLNTDGTVSGCNLCSPASLTSGSSYNTTATAVAFVTIPPAAAVFYYSFNTLAWPLTEHPECTTASYGVSGKLTDAAGKVIVNATVKLEQGSTVIATTTTSSQGNYSFPGLTPGQYYLNLNETRFLFNPPGASVTVNGNVIRNFEASWPAPFLDLPIQYDGTGSEAFGNAYRKHVTQVFDHHYPTGGGGDGIFQSYTGGDLGSLGYDDHGGYDIPKSSGTNGRVYAPAAGRVEFSGAGCFGNQVILDHGNGYKTLYGHLAQVPSLPPTVSAGDEIGIMGTTHDPGGCSYSTGVHLHFVVYYNGRLVDPSGWNGAVADPWESHQNGTISKYLWKYPLPNAQSWSVNGAVGATLASASGDYSFTIPAGSYGGTKTFGFNEVPVNEALPQGYLATGYSLVFTENYPGVTESPTAFNYTLKVQYSTTDVQDFDEDSLELFYWDTQTQVWVDLNATLNMAQNTLTVVTNKQGSFAMFGQSGQVVFLPLMLQGEGNIPAAATNLSIWSISDTTIDVIWKDNSHIEEQYQLWYLDPYGTWLIEFYDANTQHGRARNLTCNTAYLFVVRAVNYANGQAYYSDSLNINAVTLPC